MVLNEMRSDFKHVISDIKCKSVKCLTYEVKAAGSNPTPDIRNKLRNEKASLQFRTEYSDRGFGPGPDTSYGT